jgi:hypothetical protein
VRPFLLEWREYFFEHEEGSRSQMAQEMSTQTSGDTAGGGSQEVSVNSIPEAMRGFVQGALPPQGLDAFGKQLETTVNNVVELYSNMFRGIFDGFQPLFDAIGEVFSVEGHEACVQKRIKINQKDRAASTGETSQEVE